MVVKNTLMWVGVCLAVTYSNGVLCLDSIAGPGGKSLDAVLVNSDHKWRFVSRREMRYLKSFTDCPAQKLGVAGPAQHPIVKKASHKSIQVDVGGNAHEIKPPHSGGEPSTSRRNQWILRKVVCGSLGFSVLYAKFDTSRDFMIHFYDLEWNSAGAAYFSLPRLQFEGFSGGSLGRMPWRFEEKGTVFRLVLLDLDKNKDRSINRAEYVALGRYEFSISKHDVSMSGYADRPGPMLTETFLNSRPVAITPEFRVSKTIARHEVIVSGQTDEATVQVDVDHPSYLQLRSYQPTRWILLPTSSNVFAVHLWGPPPQVIDGLPADKVVLRFEEHGGSKEELDAIMRLRMLTSPPTTRQEIPAYREKQTIRIDGKVGALTVEPNQKTGRPQMSPNVSGETRALIANCASLRYQDDRIECYRLRAKVLREAKGL